MKCNIHDFTWNCMYIVEHRQAPRVHPAVPALQPGTHYCVPQRWGAVVRQAWTLCCRRVWSVCSSSAGQIFLGCHYTTVKLILSPVSEYGDGKIYSISQKHLLIFCIVGLTECSLQAMKILLLMCEVLICEALTVSL